MAKFMKLPVGDADVGRRTLCVAIDETGDEEFKSRERFFAIGGVAGLGVELLRAEQQWQKMKSLSFGGPDMPIHASDKILSREKLDAISEFFKKSRLVRFVYIIRRPPVMPPSINALHILRPMLLEELARAVGDMPVLPDDIVISIEASERLSPKIIGAFPPMSMTVDGRRIPMVGLFTPKLPPKPLLEMADQVAWRAQRQYKEYNPKDEIMPEFVSVFPRNLPHARYKEIRVASISSGSEPRRTLYFDEKDRVSVELKWGEPAVGNDGPT